MIKIKNICTFYNNPEYSEYLAEYRGDFLSEIEKVTYACGDIINSKFAVVSVNENLQMQLMKDVPSILFLSSREMFVLQSASEGTSPETTGNVLPVKNNPYLNLTGRGVLIGIVDTGIDYLNEEFIREDGTTRIETLWDQSISTTSNSNDKKSFFIGESYSSDEINAAIIAKKNGKDPYEIVPSKDTIGHGTHLASACGARGYNLNIKGVAHDCTFGIVKLNESANYKKYLAENNIDIPVYNISQIVAGLEFLKDYSISMKKPMIILLGLGSTTYSHDGLSLLSRYLQELTSTRGIILVSGTGNEGVADGHTSGVVKEIGDIQSFELSITKILKNFYFNIWIRRPNKMSLNIISPSGQQTKFILPKLNQYETVLFIFEDTYLKFRFLVPADLTGLETIQLDFTNIKPGIWKFELKGEYIINGRFDAWLTPYATVGTSAKFLSPNPYTTLTSPGCTPKAIVVSYYNQSNDSIVTEAGKGFPLSTFIKPDITAPGVNILTTSPDNKIVSVTGSSIATAITAGACALLIQWGIVNKNDPTLFSSKMINYLITAATRKPSEVYPNAEWGYGMLNIEGVLKNLAGNRSSPTEKYIEYYINDLFIRLPQEMRGDFFD